MRTLLLAVCALALTLPACDSAIPEGPDDTYPADLTRDGALLLGAWDLDHLIVRRVDRGGFVRATPLQALRITFREDGTFTRESDGHVTHEGSFAVREVCNEVSDWCSNQLFLNESHQMFWIGVDSEWLVFDYRPLDGSAEVYQRRP
ncbi:hypothetical protein BH23BAC4_BH23BAC4_03400 [soil metagenome]